MKEILASAMGVLICTSCFATSDKTSLKELNIKGVVYYVVTSKADYQEKFGEMVVSKKQVVDTLWFNDKGNLIRAWDFQMYGSPTVTRGCYYREYFYNANDLVDSIAYIHPINDVFGVYHYDANSRPTKFDLYFCDDLKGRTTWSYNATGYVKTVYGYSGNVDYTETVSGNKRTISNTSGTYTINKNGDPLSFLYINSLNDYKKKFVWTYNETGDLIKYEENQYRKYNGQWYESDDTKLVATTKYVYDDHGNWTSKITSTKYHGSTEVKGEIREFRYFESPEALRQFYSDQAEKKRQAQELALKRQQEYQDSIDAENLRKEQQRLADEKRAKAEQDSLQEITNLLDKISVAYTRSKTDKSLVGKAVSKIELIGNTVIVTVKGLEPFELKQEFEGDQCILTESRNCYLHLDHMWSEYSGRYYFAIIENGEVKSIHRVPVKVLKKLENTDIEVRGIP